MEEIKVVEAQQANIAKQQEPQRVEQQKEQVAVSQIQAGENKEAKSPSKNKRKAAEAEKAPEQLSITQAVIKDFLEDLENMANRKKFDKKMKELHDKILERQQGQLNKSLLKPLQIAQKNPQATKPRNFPQFYFQNNEKSYVKNSWLEKPVIQRQKHSPFVSHQANFQDVHANSKFISTKNMFTLNEKAHNFNQMMQSTKQSKFLGQSKATYPTIILEGKEKHPMGSFPQTQSLLTSKIDQLGGLTNNLRKFGMDSVLDRNKKTIDQHYSTFSGFMNMKMGTSNTSNFVIEPPVIQQKQPLVNPFVRKPSKI